MHGCFVLVGDGYFIFEMNRSRSGAPDLEMRSIKRRRLEYSVFGIMPVMVLMVFGVSPAKSKMMRLKSSLSKNLH